jgi:hypothetical protein
VQIGVVSHGSFSDIEGVDQLTFVDCNISVIESGAFRNLTTFSRFSMSGNHVGSVQTGAFSHLHNIDSFKMWNNTIGTVQQGAFKDLAEFGTFEFYQNVVYMVDQGAFKSVRHMGVVDINMNVFDYIRIGSVLTFSKATPEINLYANTFVCECSVVQFFSRPDIAKFLPVQKCVMPGRQDEVLKLADVAAEGTCIDREWPQTGHLTAGGHASSTARPASPATVTDRRPTAQTSPQNNPTIASRPTSTTKTYNAVPTTTPRSSNLMGYSATKPLSPTPYNADPTTTKRSGLESSVDSHDYNAKTTSLPVMTSSTDLSRVSSASSAGNDRNAAEGASSSSSQSNSGVGLRAATITFFVLPVLCQRLL